MCVYVCVCVRMYTYTYIDMHYYDPRANFHYKTRGLESHTKRCGSYFLYE